MPVLVSRQNLSLTAGTTTVDTQIVVPAYLDTSNPRLPEELMILVMPPTSGWAAVAAMSEPYFVGSTLNVDFHCTADTVINVQFWFVHSLVGPVLTEPYAAGCIPIVSVGEACTVSNGGS
jgi:hypothetical protein